MTTEAGVPNSLQFDSSGRNRLTHYAFRYPAKFHPPVVRKLLEDYSNPGQTCFDPFCGSGTLLVEALAGGRNAIGTDIDPLAVFITKAKTHRHDIAELEGRIQHVLSAVSRVRNLAPRQDDYLLTDIDEETFAAVVDAEELWVPAIPNIQHWFRRYVTIQLARILAIIDAAELSESERDFLLLCFAAIIRNCSNADPTPVSGLEVTAHMRRKEEEGRSIDPLKAFASTVSKNLAGTQAFARACDPDSTAQVAHADARKVGELGVSADVVITSPPYHNAVDYYRRHKLEMYWLGFVSEHADRLSLLPGYIGRPHVAKRHSVEVPAELAPEAIRWEARMRAVSPKRADDFLQYIASMKSVARELATTLTEGGRAIFVVGNSRFAGEEIKALDIFPDIMSPYFNHHSSLWYPVKNRYMSYARRNGADINKEFVLVFDKA